MRQKKSIFRKRSLSMLMAALLCLMSILELPQLSATAQAATSLLFKVTVTGGKGAEVTNPDDSVDPKLYDATFNCRTGKYVKLYYVTDPAPDFQKFDHWHVTVKVRIKHSKFSPVEYSYEEDLTDFCFRPDPTKFTREERQNISLALSSSEYTVSSFVSVQAVYVDNYWLVSFDPNGAEGTMEAEKANKGQSYVLPECTFTKEGYDFAGWKLGETVHQPGESIEITEDVTLEAQWTIKKFAISVDRDSGAPASYTTVGIGGVAGVVDFFEYGTTATVYASGQNWIQFANWTENGEIVSTEDTYSFTVTKTRSLVANFKACDKVSFTSGGGEGTMEDVWAFHNEEYVLPECTFTKKAYQFAAWKLGDELYQSGESVLIDGYKTFTATWEAIPELAIPIDEEHFPDEAFRTVILKKSIDLNENGILESNEQVELKSISCSGKGITDLTGIEYFTELTSLYCRKNAITALNLSANTKLEILQCHENQLTSLDLSKNTALTSALIGENPITELSVDGLTALQILNCRSNALSTINISGLTALEELTLAESASLQSVSLNDLPALKTLYCGNCSNLETLSLGNVSTLTTINVLGTKLRALDVSNNTSLPKLDCRNLQLESLILGNNDVMTELSCGYNKLESLDATGLTALTTLSCGGNQLTELPVSSAKNKKLVTLYCANNPFVSLEVSGFSKLQELSAFNCTQLKSVTLNNLPALTTMDFTGSKLMESFTMGKTGIWKLSLEEKKLKNVDLSKATQLTEIYLRWNELESLDLSHNTNLTKVYLDNNQFEDIDVSMLTELRELSITYNAFASSLDLTQNTKLQRLYCNNNHIKELNLEGLTKLASLDVSANELRNLDLSEFPALQWLHCTDNLITALDDSNCPYIRYCRGESKFQCDAAVTLYETTTPDKCRMSLSASTAEGGRAYGNGRWIKGEKVSLLAEAEEGYEFRCWMEGDKVVSRAVVYEFTGDEDRTLTAVFGKSDVTLTFKHNVEFDNNIAMHYIIPVSELEDYLNLRLVIDKEVYAEGVAMPTIQQYVLENPAPYKVNGVDYWHFTFPGISASEMGNVLSAKIVCEKDGVAYESQADVYTVKDYAYARLAKTSSASYKKVLVDMLNYGTAAQAHFKKNADNPVNADLTDEQRAFGTSMEDFSVSSAENVVLLEGTATAAFDAKNLVFGTNVELVYRMDFSSFKKDAPEGTTEDEKMANVKVVLKYNNGKGEKTVTVPYSKFTKNSGKYVASCSVLTPAEMGCTVNATIYDGDEPVSDTLQYSIESYVYNRLSGTGTNSETFKELLKRMVLYGRAVKEHF